MRIRWIHGVLIGALLCTAACVQAIDKGEEPAQSQEDPKHQRPPKAFRVVLEWGEKGEVRLLDERGRPLKLVSFDEEPLKVSEVQDIESITLMRSRVNPCVKCIVQNGKRACGVVSDQSCR